MTMIMTMMIMMMMTIMILMMMMVSRVGGRKMAEAEFPSVSRDKYESPGKNSISGNTINTSPGARTVSQAAEAQVHAAKNSGGGLRGSQVIFLYPVTQLILLLVPASLWTENSGSRPRKICWKATRRSPRSRHQRGRHTTITTRDARSSTTGQRRRTTRP